MRLIIVLISVAAILMAVAMAALGPGYRFGLWDLQTAFGVMRNYLSPPLLFGVMTPMFIAAGLSAIAFLLALAKARDLALLALVGTLAAGAAGMAPVKMRALSTGNPFIHDITTDFDDPPAIAAAASLPRVNPPDYVGDEPAPRSDPPMTVAEAQRNAFPDIAPLMLSTSLEETAQAARAAIADIGMEILAEGPVSEASGSGWRIEAVSTSFWYGFKDDFIVRLTQADGGTRVDVRSKSRVGGSDLGANAKRVRKFLAAMKPS